MLIPIQVPQQGTPAQGQPQTQIGPKPTHQTSRFVATSSSHGHITTSHPTTVPIQTTPVPKQKPGPSSQISKLVSFFIVCDDHGKPIFQQQQPRNLKMVSIDFFGAQEPRMKKITPSSASKTQRNSALEKLARKAEEAERAQAQAQGTLIQVPQASAIKSELSIQFFPAIITCHF